MILRCTGKLRALLGVQPGSLVEPEAAEIEWYANLLWLNRRKCLLFTHPDTLFSVFVPDVRKSDLRSFGDLVVHHMTRALRVEELPADALGELDKDGVKVAKTRSRVVLGCMNDMATMIEHAVVGSAGLENTDIDALNRWLHRAIHSPTGYARPVELARRRARDRP